MKKLWEWMKSKWRPRPEPEMFDHICMCGRNPGRGSKVERLEE